MSSDLGATLGTMILSTPSMHDAEMLEASTAPPVGRRRSARTCGCFSDLTVSRPRSGLATMARSSGRTPGQVAETR